MSRRLWIVTPAPAGSLAGNRRTAERYELFSRDLGHEACVAERWAGEQADVLIALHATKSHASVRGFRRAHPRAPIVVVLTGTDIYGDLGRDVRADESLALATHIVVLQSEALRSLPPQHRAKARVILQSARVAESTPARTTPDASVIQACQLAHLRPVKAPFVLADAVRALDERSRVRALHAGEALDADCAARARVENATNPRWRWVGPLAREGVDDLLAHSRALVSTSISEGGSIAIVEALVAHKPVLATRIPGSIGLLGAAHPGIFAVGDAAGLQRLLERFERDPAFEEELSSASSALAPRYAPALEMEAWRRLLEDLR